MRTVYVKRVFQDSKETLGALSVARIKGVFTAKTLELAWANNQNSISCIPTGSYLCKWTKSTRLSKEAGHDVFTYEITNVPGRAGIRIHSANYFFQLLGCIALGDSHQDINSDGELDVPHSKDAVNAFNLEMNKEDFILTIS